MPISAQNPNTITINAVFIPQINLSTVIKPDGTIQTAAYIRVVPAQHDAATDTWLAAGEGQQIVVGDVLNLPSDIAAAQSAVTAAYLALAGAIAQINAIRKVV